MMRMSQYVNPDKQLDCVGQYCPMPVFKTRQELDKLNVGQVLEVIADDPASKTDIPQLIKTIKQELLKVTEDNGAFHFFIKKIKQ